MALFSVWDWDRNAYRVYQTRAPASVGDDPEPPRPDHHPLGAVPDIDVKVLPSGARFMGYDHQARGEIVRLRGRGLGSGDTELEVGGNRVLIPTPSLKAIAIVAVLGGLWWWSAKKGR